ncbi:probable calmodulin-binding transcription activator 2 at N-terminal half [Coccomyxa sp. Obi]|nr:probable calmodulin-binding transcription activator 2 at N-terminal half [Coccomyxa sp. Obi]
MGQLAVPAEQLGSGTASPTEQLPKVLRDILTKARTSWLRNQEVVDLLTNYRTYRFRVSKEPPQKPPGGSLFLFNRKTVRFFRKDGHDWRKKSDGKTVRETHEKLKVGNKEILNCYYAHAGDSLQRRCYWLLDGDDNVVLVHYLSSNPQANCVLRSPLLSSDPSFSGALPLNALEATLPYPQQTSSSTAWHAAPSNELSRTSSVPDNFGSSTSRQAAQQAVAMPSMFTVTTGDIVMRMAPDGETSASEPTDARSSVFRQLPTPFSVPDKSVGGVPHAPALNNGDARPEHSLSDFSRAASVPAHPTARSASGQLASTIEDAMRLGPLHSAPSFSAGTVQTGSTVDPLDLQRARSTNGTSAHLMSEPMTIGNTSMSGNSSMDHQAPALRLEFKGTSPSSGPMDAPLRSACALQSQDIGLSLAHSGSTGRLSRDTSTTLAGGLQRRDPSLKLGLGL